MIRQSTTLTIGDRELTVQFGWTERYPPSWTDPGSPGGPEIDQIWEDSEVADVTLAGVYVLRRQAALDPREGNQASEQYRQPLAERETELVDE